MVERILRLVWVIILAAVLLDFSITVKTQPTSLLDVSYSSRVIFGKALESYKSFLKSKGFKILEFGSDTLSDIGGAIKRADCPCLLISDGMNNSSTDPVSASVNKKVFVLLPDTQTLVAKVKNIYLRTPVSTGELAELKVEFSSCLNDTVKVILSYGIFRKFSCEEARFKIKLLKSVDTVSIITMYDTVRFPVFSQKVAKPAFLVWKPMPFIRFIRRKFVDATVILKKDSIIKEDAPVIFLVSPPSLMTDKPSIVFVGENTRGFRKITGTFFIKMGVPPIRTIYVPEFKVDRAYETWGKYILIARKDNALLVLSPDIWKIWLADSSSFHRFMGYVDETINFNAEAFLEKPVFFLGENFNLLLSGYGIDMVSINSGKKVGFQGFHTFKMQARDTGVNTIKVEFFKGRNRVFEQTLKYYVINYPVEKAQIGVDLETLKGIAEVSGGRILKDTSEVKGITGKSTKKYSAFNPGIVFIVILLAICEWAIRRYRGKI